MKKILILKTASENVINKLFDKLNNENADKFCLVQSSLVKYYVEKYPEYIFVDIKQEGFYNLSEKIIAKMKELYFNTVYIPTTSTRATNFGNIVEIIKQLNYERIVFYNCSGEISIIEKKSKLEEKLIKIYIKLMNKLYFKG